MPLGMPNFYSQTFPPQARQDALMRLLGQFGTSLLGRQAVLDPGGAVGRGLGAGFNAYDAYLAQQSEFQRQQELDALRRQQLGFERQQALTASQQRQQQIGLTERGLQGDEDYRAQRLELEAQQLEEAARRREEDVAFRERGMALDESRFALDKQRLELQIENIRTNAEKVGIPDIDTVISTARTLAAAQLDALSGSPHYQANPTELPSMGELFQGAFNMAAQLRLQQGGQVETTPEGEPVIEHVRRERTEIPDREPGEIGRGLGLGNIFRSIGESRDRQYQEAVESREDAAVERDIESYANTLKSAGTPRIRAMQILQERYSDKRIMIMGIIDRVY